MAYLIKNGLYFKQIIILSFGEWFQFILIKLLLSKEYSTLLSMLFLYVRYNFEIENPHHVLPYTCIDLTVSEVFVCNSVNTTLILQSTKLHFMKKNLELHVKQLDMDVNEHDYPVRKDMDVNEHDYPVRKDMDVNEHDYPVRKDMDVNEHDYPIRKDMDVNEHDYPILHLDTN